MRRKCRVTSRGVFTEQMGSTVPKERTSSIRATLEPRLVSTQQTRLCHNFCCIGYVGGGCSPSLLLRPSEFKGSGPCCVLLSLCRPDKGTLNNCSSQLPTSSTS